MRTEDEWIRSVRGGRGRRLTSPNTKNNRTAVWTHIAIIKYTVASATMVLNKVGNRRLAALEYANQRIRRNAERSDTASRELLAMAAYGATH